MSFPPIPDPAAATRLDASKLDVYAVALEFQTLAADLMPKRRHGVLRDQLERASVSILLNLAEGAGRFAPADKARLYSIARGSAMECGGILDVLLARKLITAAAYRRLHGLLVRIVAMLTKLHARMLADAERAAAERPFP
jgi:four helix bundle protein